MSEKTKIRVLIVDDEPLGRKMLRSMLAPFDEVKIIGECENGSEAVEAIKSQTPDLVFLDVKMPDVDGFSVIENIEEEKKPAVIFVTAYDKYAIRAFEINALDYLLKPYDRKRFEQSFRRALNQINKQQNEALNKQIISLLSNNSSSEENYLERFIIKDSGRVFFIKTDEILWIEAEGNYVFLHTLGQKYIFREGITKLEKKLDPQKFRRIARSAIVNLDFVQELQPLFRGDYQVILKNGIELKLTHRYRKNLIQHFGGSL